MVFDTCIKHCCLDLRDLKCRFKSSLFFVDRHVTVELYRKQESGLRHKGRNTIELCIYLRNIARYYTKVPVMYVFVLF